MFKTMEQIASDVISELGLASGEAVQMYTEPQVVRNINTAFQHLAKKRFWNHMTFTSTHAVDETGMLTTDLEVVNDVNDILWVRVFPYENRDALPFYNDDPYVTGKPPGYELIPFGHELQEKRVIRLVPPGQFDEVKVRARRILNIDKPTMIVPFDAVCLQHFVTANILANDGMNPPAQQRHDALFTQRYQDLVSSEARGPITLGRPASNSFTVADTPEQVYEP